VESYRKGCGVVTQRLRRSMWRPGWVDHKRIVGVVSGDLETGICSALQDIPRFDIFFLGLLFLIGYWLRHLELAQRPSQTPSFVDFEPLWTFNLQGYVPRVAPLLYGEKASPHSRHMP